jgi:filamentous hemagglutinin
VGRAAAEAAEVAAQDASREAGVLADEAGTAIQTAGKAVARAVDEAERTAAHDVPWTARAKGETRGSEGPAAANVDRNKFKYLFGRAAADPHNTPRSTQMLRQFTTIGLHDTPEGRSVLLEHLLDAAADPDNVVRTLTDKYGTSVMRDSLLAGPRGLLHIQSTWMWVDGAWEFKSLIAYGAKEAGR